MDTVWHVSRQRHWKGGTLKDECRKWFSLLLKAVEIKKGVESILGIFLASSNAVIWVADFHPHIKSEVCLPTPFLM